MSVEGASSPLAALRAEVRDSVGSRRYLLLALGMPLAFYLLYTAAGLGGAADRPIAGTTWASYFMVSMASFAAIGAALGVAGARPTTTRVGLGMIGRFGAAMVLVLPPLALLCLAGVTVNGVELPPGGWLELLASLWLGTVPFVALGLLLSVAFDADAVGVVALGVAIVLALLGGLFQPIRTLPAAMVAIAHVVPSYHLAALGWTAIVGRGPEPVDIAVLAGYTVVVGAVLTWRLRWRSRNGATRADG